MTVFLRQLWNDPRLQFTDGSEPVNVDVSLLKSLWVPDLFVVNEKSANFHSVTKDNKLLRISPTGDVLLSQRLVSVVIGHVASSGFEGGRAVERGFLLYYFEISILADGP